MLEKIYALWRGAASEAWNNKGFALKRLGQYTEAIECYDQALALDKKYKEAWNNKGFALDALGKYTEAIECYDQALALDKKYKAAWNNKGFALDALGKYTEAIECYDQALALDKKYKAAWNNKGGALSGLGQYTETIECYDQVLALDKKVKEAWNNKGRTLHDLGKYTEAIECFDQALALDEKLKEAWNNKGRTLHDLGKYTEAIECFDQALALDEKLATAWKNKLLAFLFKYDFNSAKKCLEKLADLTIATNPQTIFIKALYAFATKEKFNLIHSFETVDEHFKQFQNSQKIHEQLDVYVMAGKFFVEYGALKEAEACLQKGFTLQKNNLRLKQVEKTLQARHDKITIQSGLYEENSWHFDTKQKTEGSEALLNKNNDNRSILHNKDPALYEECQRTEAIACYDQVLALDQKDIDAWNAKNLALKKMDQYNELIRLDKHNLSFQAETLSLQVEKLTSDNQLLEAENKKLHDEKNQLEKRRENLLCVVETITPQLYIAHSENEVSKKARNDLLIALEGANEKTHELKTQLSLREENIQKLLDEKEVLQASFDKEKFVVENKELKKENEQCKAQQAVLYSDHEMLKYDHEKVVQEKVTLFNENHHLRNEREKQRTEKKNLEESLKLAEDGETKKDKEIEKLHKKLEEFKKENNKLKFENQDLKKTINDLEKTIKEQKESIDKLVKNDRKKQIKINDLEKRLSKMESENSDEKIMDKISHLFNRHGHFKHQSQTSLSENTNSSISPDQNINSPKNT